MNMAELLHLEYLWTNPEGDWVLFKSPNLRGGYCVFNKFGSVLLIEDAEINEAVCKKMLEAGCKVLESITIGEATVSAVEKNRANR